MILFRKKSAMLNNSHILWRCLYLLVKSQMIQQPLTAKLIAEAPDTNKLLFIEGQYRVLIGVTSLGVLVGILLFQKKNRN
ncbi:DUF2837 family protein [Bacillus sp. CH30_1T]|uniref:lipid II flippase family protein n=1 Tax=Bacillus sp. CH30_1T TaxID=2604836 RepID=UPI0011EF22DC|nr:DUF2837 family protein [Bacillus sp. CH30_1T]KAA0560122.1 DUF2837 family protein [Bacillus sp. CH30_1T]